MQNLDSVLGKLAKFPLKLLQKIKLKTMLILSGSYWLIEKDAILT
jgi:hypothetical protein